MSIKIVEKFQSTLNSSVTLVLTHDNVVVFFAGQRRGVHRGRGISDPETGLISPPFATKETNTNNQMLLQTNWSTVINRLDSLDSTTVLERKEEPRIVYCHWPLDVLLLCVRW